VEAVAVVTMTGTGTTEAVLDVSSGWSGYEHGGSTLTYSLDQTTTVANPVTTTDVDTSAATTVVVTTTAVVAAVTTGEVVDTETSVVTTPGLGTRLLGTFSRLSDTNVANRLEWELRVCG
jgi:hypothetical protein